MVIPVSLRVEAAGPNKQTVLDLLHLQAARFFGDEDFRLDGDVHIEVEVYSDDGVKHNRWAGLADYVNYREEDR
jgi:hypothetical protein